jgi:hypothetical protein
MISNQDLVLKLVVAERRRQDELVAAGKLPFNCADRAVGSAEKLRVIGEEFGEVCEASYEVDYPPGPRTAKAVYERHGHLLAEVVQLAATAVAFAESLVDSDAGAPIAAADEADPMKLAQALLRDGELQRVPAWLVGQLKDRLKGFNRGTHQWNFSSQKKDRTT